MTPDLLCSARVVAVIEEERANLGITEANMSKALGCSAGFWRRRTKGYDLDFMHFYRACKAIGRPMSWVLREVERRWP